MIEARKRPTTAEYIAAGAAYRAFAIENDQPTEEQWKSLEPTLAVLVDAFEAVHWKAHQVFDASRVPALKALLADIGSSHYCMRKDTGSGAAIWLASSGMSEEQHMRLLTLVRNLTPHNRHSSKSRLLCQPSRRNHDSIYVSCSVSF